jgi:hypothetical protein
MLTPKIKIHIHHSIKFLKVNSPQIMPFSYMNDESLLSFFLFFCLTYTRTTFYGLKVADEFSGCDGVCGSFFCQYFRLSISQNFLFYGEMYTQLPPYH